MACPRAASAIVLAALLAPAAPRAKAEQLPVKAYTTVDGLASDRINCILRDSHGYLWFGTWDRISRFDGYTFENLTEGLPGPSVNAILEAREGTFWAAKVTRHPQGRDNPPSGGHEWGA